MIIEILKYGFMVLVAGAQVLIVGMFLIGFWNGFTYESGRAGSKYHVWFKLLPFKRFFIRKRNFDSNTEAWVRGAVTATFKGYSEWMHSENCRVRHKDSLIDISNEVEIYSLDKDMHSLLKLIETRLSEYGIKWKIETLEKERNHKNH